MRVVIADDSALLREGLARLLVESDVEVCGTAADADELVAAVARAPVRTSRSSTSGCRRRTPTRAPRPRSRCARSCPSLGVLLLSQAVETHFAAQLLERHAERFGYLLKDRVIDVDDPDRRPAHDRRAAARCSTPRSSGT